MHTVNEFARMFATLAQFLRKPTVYTKLIKIRQMEITMTYLLSQIRTELTLAAFLVIGLIACSMIS